MSYEMPSDDELRKIYADVETIAVVGASADEKKPAYRIPRYLQSVGYRLVPVSPKGGEILGEAVATSLADVDVSVDVVDVFRPAEEAAGIAREAVRLQAKVLWLQPGTVSDEAIRIAEEGGLRVVAGACMGETHGRLGLGPGPNA